MMEHWLCCGRLQEFKLLPPSPAISLLKIEFIPNYELRGGADSGGVSTDPLTSVSLPVVVCQLIPWLVSNNIFTLERKDIQLLDGNNSLPSHDKTCGFCIKY